MPTTMATRLWDPVRMLGAPWYHRYSNRYSESYIAGSEQKDDPPVSLVADNHVALCAFAVVRAGTEDVPLRPPAGFAPAIRTMGCLRIGHAHRFSIRGDSLQAGLRT